MCQIGFEWMTERALSVMPGDVFSILVRWNGVKWTSSIGKDVFHTGGLVLPNKRLTGTGRIHFLTKLSLFETLQAGPSRLLPCPDPPPVHVQVELAFPRESIGDAISQTTSLKVCKKDDKGEKLTKEALYFSPESIRWVHPKRIQIDLPPTNRSFA